MIQFEDLASEVSGIVDRLERASFRDALVEAGKAFGEEVAGNFERNEDSEGQPWAPHAPLTVKLYGPHPLLRLTWAMHAAAIDLNNEAAKYLLEDRVITIGIDGNELPYAAVHDQGGGRIPKREFFYLNEQSQDRVGEVLEEECFKVVQDILPG